MSDRVSEAQARALWKRATELQADAERDRPGGELRPAVPARGLSVEQVTEVAEEVGISRDKVLVALAEERLSDTGSRQAAKDPSPLVRLLVEDTKAVEVELVVDAPPTAVARALHRLTAGPDFSLTLEDRLAPDPEREIVVVYRNAGRSGLVSSEFHGAMHVSDARVVVASIAGREEGSLVTLRFPTYERGVNLAVSGGAVVLGGSGGLASGVWTGEQLAALAGMGELVFVAYGALLGGLAGAGIGVAAFRRLQRWGYGKGREALRRLARALSLELEAD